MTLTLRIEQARHSATVPPKPFEHGTHASYQAEAASDKSGGKEGAAERHGSSSERLESLRAVV